jgi:nitrous oxidase accessory protein NosD
MQQQQQQYFATYQKRWGRGERGGEWDDAFGFPRGVDAVKPHSTVTTKKRGFRFQT